MTQTETITIRVAPDAARVFRAISAGEQRKIEALLSLRLLELAQQPEALEEVMRDISSKAQARGLTPDILDALLQDEFRL